MTEVSSAKSGENHSKKTLNPEHWVDQYGDYLYHFAIGRLRNHEDAENAVQEAFLSALNAMTNFAGRSSERTWLTSILKYKIIDHIRKRYRERPVIQEDENAPIENLFDHKGSRKKMPSGWLPNPKELLEKKEFWEIFQQCQEKLPQTTNDAFTLKEIEKMEGKEICEILNITPSNFWVLLHRARLQLRECLEENWFDAPKKE